MGKGIKDVDKKDTKLLYKKSMTSIHTHSRTNSIQPQAYARSGRHLTRRSSREHEYYNDGVSLKRDLSIETDICIMRNNIRRKKNKKSDQEVYSQKSKLSTFTVRDSVLGKDKPGAGDSYVTIQNADVVSLIVDNFRTLLNKWIREYLVDSSDNLQKIEAIRESLLRKLEKRVIRNQGSRSDIITKHNIKIHNRLKGGLRSRHMPKKVNTFNCEVNYSNYTVPFQSKKFRIISTLSIPRNFNKPPMICKEPVNRLFRVKKISHSNIFVSLKEPKELFVDSATFVMLTMSSQTFTKHCATYNEIEEKENNPSEESLLVKNTFYAKPSLDKPSSGDGLQIPLNHHPLPMMDKDTISLVKNIYKYVTSEKDTTHNTLLQISSENNKNTMTENSLTDLRLGNEHHNLQIQKCQFCCNHRFVKSDQILNKKAETDKSREALVFSEPIPRNVYNLENVSSRKSCSRNDRAYKKRVPTKVQKIKTYKSNIDDIKYRHFTYLYRKASKNMSSSNEFINHFQSIINYFENYDEQKHITLDVHVNVLPIVNNSGSEEENSNSICKNQNNPTTVYRANCGNLDTLMEFRETESNTTKESKSSASESPPEIISLLDGAESKAKYMVIETNSIVVENKENIKETLDNVDLLMSNNRQDICQQINSLKNVIQGLTATAEKLMLEHIRERKNTLSSSTQVEAPALCDAAVNATQSAPHANTPMNLNPQSYALWFSQNQIHYNTVPEIMKQVMNAELENYEMLRESAPVMGVPYPTSLCLPNTDSNMNLKATNQKENTYSPSKGLQFSYNLNNDTACSGFKLQKVSKNTSDFLPLPVKKPSFCIIESESVLKVTDMTSKGEIPVDVGHNEVGLSCSFPNPSVHYEVSSEKNPCNMASLFVKQQSCGDGSFNESESKCICPESCEYDIKKSADTHSSYEFVRHHSSVSQHLQSDQARKKSIDTDEYDEFVKSSRKKQCYKFCKICLYISLICIPLVVVTLVLYFTYIKQIWGQRKTLHRSVKTDTGKANKMSDLLFDFGF